MGRYDERDKQLAKLWACGWTWFRTSSKGGAVICGCGKHGPHFLPKTPSNPYVWFNKINRWREECCIAEPQDRGRG